MNIGILKGMNNDENLVHLSVMLLDFIKSQTLAHELFTDLSFFKTYKQTKKTTLELEGSLNTELYHYIKKISNICNNITKSM